VGKKFWRGFSESYLVGKFKNSRSSAGHVKKTLLKFSSYEETSKLITAAIVVVLKRIII
jgi:hypothetical protein